MILQQALALVELAGELEDDGILALPVVLKQPVLVVYLLLGVCEFAPKRFVFGA